MNIYTLNLKPLANLITVEHFEQLCQLNPDLKLETNHQGELIIMPPTGYETEKITLINCPIRNLESKVQARCGV